MSAARSAASRPLPVAVDRPYGDELGGLGGEPAADRLSEATARASPSGRSNGREPRMLLVEQHVRKALGYCDRAYAMHRGHIELSGSLPHRGDRVRVHVSPPSGHALPWQRSLGVASGLSGMGPGARVERSSA